MHLIYVTCSSPQEALQIGRVLVTERLAACSNILPGMTSIYHWNERLEEAVETLLLLKTKTDLLQCVTERVKELHSAECPGIIAWEISPGNQEFFEWLNANTIDRF